MTTLFMVFGALILAVMARAILDPLPSHDHKQTEAAAAAEQREHMMQAITLSVF